MTDELLKQLEAHSSYFTSMLAMIPDKYMHENEELLKGGGKFYRNKRERKPKQLIKEASKRAKRLKLDPEHTEGGTVEAEPQPELPHVLQRFSVEGKQSGSLNDLREKLRTKIEALQSRREVVHEGGKKKKVAVKNKDKKKQIKSIAKTTTATTKKPSVVREDGKIVFSKFDFTTPSEPSDKLDKQKKVNYKKLLAKAEAKEQNLKELKEKDAKRSDQLEEQLSWRKAINKARGNKTKDDPGMLKKTLKRKEQQKRSSKMKWKERRNQESKRMEQRQERRQRHIKERLEAKKSRKMGSKAKKSKVKKTRNPGF